MKKTILILIIAICFVSLYGCSQGPSDTLESSSVTDIASSAAPSYMPSDLSSGTTPSPTHKSSLNMASGNAYTHSDLNGDVTRVTWKAIEDNFGYIRLYLIVNGEEHYCGQYWGAMSYIEINDRLSDSVLSFFVSQSQGIASEFYLLKKNDHELAVKYHYVPYKFDSDHFKLSDYEEILVIPFKEGSDIVIDEEAIIEKLYIPVYNPIFENG